MTQTVSIVIAKPANSLFLGSRGRLIHLSGLERIPLYTISMTISLPIRERIRLSS